MDCSLIETLRWEPGAGFVRLERHLARLTRSAAALGLPGAEGARGALLAALPALFPEGAELSQMGFAPHPNLLPACGEKVAGRPDEELYPSASILPEEERAGRAEGGSVTPQRIRLELFPDGRIDVQAAPFKPLPPDTAWRVKIAATRLSSADPLLRHKTSRRAVYAAARAEFPAGEADEVLLLNERGEPCEGTITSLFLDDGSGVLKTPPLSAGLLAGVLREELLETGRAVEQELRRQDLVNHTFFIGNSLRGLIRAALYCDRKL